MNGTKNSLALGVACPVKAASVKWEVGLEHAVLAWRGPRVESYAEDVRPIGWREARILDSGDALRTRSITWEWYSQLGLCWGHHLPRV